MDGDGEGEEGRWPERGRDEVVEEEEGRRRRGAPRFIGTRAERAGRICSKMSKHYFAVWWGLVFGSRLQASDARFRSVYEQAHARFQLLPSV